MDKTGNIVLSRLLVANWCLALCGPIVIGRPFLGRLGRPFEGWDAGWIGPENVGNR
jgi:hypothetical protein